MQFGGPISVMHSPGQPARFPSLEQMSASNNGMIDLTGIPAEVQELVIQLAALVRATGSEPLSDPMTLWRFLNSRDFNVLDAEDMYRSSIQWRAECNIGRLMSIYGSGALYTADGNRAGDPLRWDWNPSSPQTLEAALVQQYGFWGKLAHQRAADGAPIIIWRLGAVDLDSYAREGIMEVMSSGLVAHFEDMLQSSRVVSHLQKRILRVRLVIDGDGLGMHSLRHVNAFRQMTNVGKQYFPDCTATVTIIRAPRTMGVLYKSIQHMMTAGMRQKICILGDDFEDGLRRHAGIEVQQLPESMGGLTPDSEIAATLEVPEGAGDALGQ